MPATDCKDNNDGNTAKLSIFLRVVPMATLDIEPQPRATVALWRADPLMICKCLS